MRNPFKGIGNVVLLHDKWSCIAALNATTEHEHQNKLKYIGVQQMKRVNERIERMSATMTKRQLNRLKYKK